MPSSFSDRRWASTWQMLRLLAVLIAAAGGIFWALQMAAGKPMLIGGTALLSVTSFLWVYLALTTLRELPPTTAGQAMAPAAVLLLGLGAGVVLAGAAVRIATLVNYGPVLPIIGGLSALLGLLALPKSALARIPDLRAEGTAAVLLAAAGIVAWKTGWF